MHGHKDLNCSSWKIFKGPELPRVKSRLGRGVYKGSVLHLEMVWRRTGSRHGKEVSASAVGAGPDQLCL